jgi:tetratricopeptide (TPR) repeat protein
MATMRLVLLLISTAIAAPPSQEEQARAHFLAGQADYAAGRYEEALHEFEVGYALAPRPEFLINFAQTDRKLGRYQAAVVHIEQYLATGPAPALEEEARRLLKVVREEQSQVVPAPVVIAPPAPPPPAKPKSRAWIWGVVAGAVAVVAAGVATAVVLSEPETTWPSSTLGRYSFR